MTLCWNLGGYGGSWMGLGSLVMFWMCSFDVNKLNFKIWKKIVMFHGVKTPPEDWCWSLGGCGGSWLGLGSLITCLMFSYDAQKLKGILKQKYKCLSNERRGNSETNCVGPRLKFHLWPEKFKKNCLQQDIQQFCLHGEASAVQMEFQFRTNAIGLKTSSPNTYWRLIWEF